MSLVRKPKLGWSLKGAGQVKQQRQALQAQIREFAASAPLTVTPDTLALVTAAFAPVVLTPRVVTPGKLALVLTTFAPAVATPRLVTPGKLALSLTTFTPSIRTPRVVTPGKLSLTISEFAPTVLTPRVVTPGKLALTLTTFAPSASVPLSVVVTPPTAHLRIEGYSPEVAGDPHSGAIGHVVSDTGRRRRFPLQPDEQPEPVTVAPATAHLKVKGHAPSIVKSSAVAFTLEEIAALASEVSEEELVALLAA